MDIDTLRKDIDTTDDAMKALFVKRMQTASQIAAYKKSKGLPVADRQREREILTRLTLDSPPEMEMYIKSLFTTLFGLSRSFQTASIGSEHPLAERIRQAIAQTPPLFPSKAVVACQGVEGAYSQMAADKLFALPHIMYFTSFEGVFQAVEKGLCRYGVLPIENSSHGSVTQVYDLMKRHDFHIVRSLKMKIDHCLLANPGSTQKDIREIFSHEQAIAQCSEYLQKLKDVKVTVCENTAAAAQLVAQSGRKDAAAISSQYCAELYGLEVVDGDVQNSASNFTRFICISKNLEIYPGADKISIMLALPHRPGSLYETISRFSAMGLNLTKLESRPIPDRDFEFMFYFDMEASLLSEGVISLLCSLASDCDQFDFLGSYSEA
ncbi:MAG: P-protein [Firmicutes bacterium ADurb.Bin262]|nr:MAG: P-protein [Firmicutes bacterium ADurb.Bin262]